MWIFLRTVYFLRHVNRVFLRSEPIKNFSSVRNNLPKDLLKAKDQFLKTGPCEGLHSSKLNSAKWIIRKYRKLHVRVCFACFSQIQLQQLFTGKESIVLKSLPAVVVLSYSYFTASEKENLWTERKLNHVIKNEKRKKNSDYYYLSNRKVIEIVCSSPISLLAFYSSEEVLSTQVCSLGSISITVMNLK